VLCSLVAELLGAERVGIDDGFFELGGDSILSIQLAARARKAGVVFTVRDVFTHRTVAKLAEHARDPERDEEHATTRHDRALIALDSSEIEALEAGWKNR
jgi:nonribosomal peptide synthetase CepA